MDVYKKTFLFLSSLLLIQCNAKAPQSTSNRFVKSGASGCEENRIQGEYLVVWKDGSISVENSQNDKEFIEEFIEEHKDEILTSEPHYRLQTISHIEFEQRDWGGGINWGVAAIAADKVWDQAASLSEVIVAVIDSGMDMTHPELKNILAINPDEIANGIDDDENGLIDDINGYDFVGDSGKIIDYTGHGTHVSGVIAARHDVGKVLGVAPNAKILPINFINSNGGGDVSAAISAIRYASSRKAKVINASWGGEGCSIPLKNEIAALAEKNILFVTAAGNSGSNLEMFPEFPAAFGLDNIITVGASTYDKKTAGFSNYGSFVDLVAPGANIISTYPKDFDKDGNSDGIVALNGTSMAAPFVSASAALLWGQKPSASYIEIKEALRKGIESGPYRVSTRGQLNIKKALESLKP